MIMPDSLRKEDDQEDDFVSGQKEIVTAETQAVTTETQMLEALKDSLKMDFFKTEAKKTAILLQYTMVDIEDELEADSALSNSNDLRAGF